MMKKLLCLLLLLFPLQAMAQGIPFFSGSWQALLQEAQKSGKPIFLDCYTSWCGPCKRMEKEVFPQPEVGSFMGSSFLCYQLDMESAEGIAVKSRYGVRAYPTLLFLSPQAEALHEVVGALDAPALLQTAKDALQPETQNLRMQQAFQQVMAPDFLRRYTLSLLGRGQDAMQAGMLYFGQLPTRQWTQGPDWKLLRTLLAHGGPESDLLRATLLRRDSLLQILSPSQLDSALLPAYAPAFREVLRTHSRPQLEALEQTLQAALSPAAAEKEIAEFSLFFFREDPSIFGRLQDFADRHARTPQSYGMLAALGLERAKSPAQLKQVLGWAQESLRQTRSFDGLLLLGQILCKLESRKEALHALQEAIAQGKAEDADISEAEELLQRLR